MSAILIVAGGSVFAILGLLHAFYTWADTRRPRRLVPDAPSVIEAIALGASLPSMAPPKSLLLAPVAIGSIYLWLAIRYWFRVPALGIATGTACFLVGWVIY